MTESELLNIKLRNGDLIEVVLNDNRQLVGNPDYICSLGFVLSSGVGSENIHMPDIKSIRIIEKGFWNE